MKENLVLRRIGDEYIIIVPDQHTVDMTEVYTLNEMSVSIWEHFKNEVFTVEQVVDFILEHYEVERDRAVSDIQAFLERLKSEQLIVDD
jgi:hypothetical protein